MASTGAVEPRERDEDDTKAPETLLGPLQSSRVKEETPDLIPASLDQWRVEGTGIGEGG